MRSDEKRRRTTMLDDLEDVTIIMNLLELQIRLRAETDSIENQKE